MKKTLLVCAFIATSMLAGCGVQTSSNIDFKPENISYFHDSRVDKCFAVMASRRAFKASATGLGMAEVSCDEKVMNLVKNK